jgi:hypothetical protein
MRKSSKGDPLLRKTNGPIEFPPLRRGTGSRPRCGGGVMNRPTALPTDISALATHEVRTLCRPLPPVAALVCPSRHHGDETRAQGAMSPHQF